MNRLVLFFIAFASLVLSSSHAINVGPREKVVQLTGFQAGYYESNTDQVKCIEGNWSLEERGDSLVLMAAGTPMVSNLGEPASQGSEPSACQSSSQGSYTKGQMVQVSRVSCPGRSTLSTRRTITFEEGVIRYSQVNTIEGMPPTRLECELIKKPNPYTPQSL